MITKRRFAKAVPTGVHPPSGCLSLHDILYDDGRSASASNDASEAVTFDVRIVRVESSKTVFDVRRGAYTVNVDAESGPSGEYPWKNPASSNLLVVEIRDEKIEMAAVTREAARSSNPLPSRERAIERRPPETTGSQRPPRPRRSTRPCRVRATPAGRCPCTTGRSSVALCCRPTRPSCRP